MIQKHYRFLACASLAVLFSCLPCANNAQARSLIFERGEIQIAVKPVKTEDGSVTALRPPIKLSVELRPEDSLRLEYIHTLNTLNDETGVMIALDAPASVPLPAMKVYMPVDVLFIADDGYIVQISPHVVLADITQNIQARVPIRALLFLRDGAATAYAIHLSDRVSGKMFTPAPETQE